MASILIWVVSLSILAGQLLGASSILQVVAGLPRWVGAVTAAGVVVAYFVAGGLLSSAWVNLVQLAIKLSGFAIALPLALGTVGGWTGLRSSGELADRYFDFTGGSGSTLWLIALLAPAFIVSPGLVQKAYGAVNARAIRIGVGVNAVALLAFAIVPVTLGMMARVHHPHLASADLALPSCFDSDLPPLVGALTLASVFAAEVSAADAVLFMLSTSLSQDLYRRFLAPDADDAQMVKVARWSAGVASAAGLVMALVLPTVVDALKIFYSVLTVALVRSSRRRSVMGETVERRGAWRDGRRAVGHAADYRCPACGQGHRWDSAGRQRPHRRLDRVRRRAALSESAR